MRVSRLLGILACVAVLPLVSCRHGQQAAQSGSLINKIVLSSSSRSSSSSFSSSSSIVSRSSASSSSGAVLTSSIAPAAELAVDVQADRTEVRNGERVSFVVTVRNTSAEQDLRAVILEFTYPAVQMAVKAPDGASTDQNHISWNVGVLPALSLRTLTIGAQLSSKLQAGDRVVVLLQASAQGTTSRLATAEVLVTNALMPQTGAEERFFAPIEDARRFVR